MTPRDLAYNNSTAVPDSPAIMARLTADSAQLKPDRVLRYGPSPRNEIDIFAGDPAKPCLFFIHGGYWQRNNREMFWALADGVRAHGWSAAFPGYTLAPDASLTQIVAEIHAALDTLARPVIVSGWSAGGHLTAMAMSHRNVNAGLAISGVFELAPIRGIYLDEKLNLTDQEIETLSPLRLDMPAKPLAFAYGSAELAALVADSRAMHAKNAGVLLSIPGANHFTILADLRAKDGLITRQLRAL